jgi:hypothetical protein
MLAVAAVGCESSTVVVVPAGGSGGGTPVDPYQPAWYDVYGYYCGQGLPTPGCNFYADGVKIADFEDPYFNSSYNLYFDYWTFYDSYGYAADYYGWAWLSPTGILYDEYGYALNENQENGGRDVLADLAEKEEAVVTAAGKGLTQKFPALSEARGIEIASALNDWAKLGKKGGRTEADYRAFNQRLLGVSSEDTQKALEAAKTGDIAGLEALNTEIADHWSTDAETSKAILKSWYKKQLAEAGLN